MPPDWDDSTTGGIGRTISALDAEHRERSGRLDRELRQVEQRINHLVAMVELMDTNGGKGFAALDLRIAQLSASVNRSARLFVVALFLLGALLVARRFLF